MLPYVESIYAMTNPRSKSLEIMWNLGKPVAIHMAELLITKGQTQTTNHWLSELDAWLSNINDKRRVKGNSVISAEDTIDALVTLVTPTHLTSFLKTGKLDRHLPKDVKTKLDFGIYTRLIEDLISTDISDKLEVDYFGVFDKTQVLPDLKEVMPASYWLKLGNDLEHNWISR